MAAGHFHGKTPMTETTTLPCAVCRKPLERMDGDPDAPYAANIFVSYGHYGATAFDAPGGEYLELFICTPCLEIMKANSAIHRVLYPTDAVPEQRNLWGSTADPREDNPWNRQRLRNEFAMDDFLNATAGMTQEWARAVFTACQEASRAGRAFDPATVPAPVPSLEDRLVEAIATCDTGDGELTSSQVILAVQAVLKAGSSGA